MVAVTASWYFWLARHRYKCPFCGRYVQYNDVNCKHCGNDMQYKHREIDEPRMQVPLGGRKLRDDGTPRRRSPRA